MVCHSEEMLNDPSSLWALNDLTFSIFLVFLLLFFRTYINSYRRDYIVHSGGERERERERERKQYYR